jgi:peptidoglycan/xylan/chitin deacetylase (PgdA/CDA1 family)
MLAMDPWWIAAPTVAAGLAGLAAYGAVRPSSQLFGSSLYATDAPRKFALTFDDGPNPSITPKLLDLLDRHNVKATFFVVGNFVRQCPALVKETYARGHVIGNHTDTHPNLFFCGPADTSVELQRCSEAILNATWESPRFFRPPFGFRSPWLGEIAHRFDMHLVTWTLLPGDWRGKPAEWLIPRMQPIATNAQRLRKQQSPTPITETPGGDILCLHDGNFRQQNADRAHTLAALEYWLPRWRDLGLEFVTMNQAFGKAVEA